MFVVPDYIRGLIFDCDGTIADTMPMHYRAWVQTMREQGREFSLETFHELAGVPTRAIIEILNDRYAYNLPVDEVAARRDCLFEELIPGISPIEPVAAIVNRYHGKLPMAVATGSNRTIVERVVHVLGLSDFFKTIVSADDVQRGKPAPDIFLEAARRLGLSPVTCCVFEDSQAGLTAAQAAKMLAIDVRLML